MLGLIVLNTKYFTQAKETEQHGGQVMTDFLSVPTFPHLEGEKSTNEE